MRAGAPICIQCEGVPGYHSHGVISSRREVVMKAALFPGMVALLVLSGCAPAAIPIHTGGAAGADPAVPVHSATPASTPTPTIQATPTATETATATATATLWSRPKWMPNRTPFPTPYRPACCGLPPSATPAR
jgi:hypothetical protein